MVTIFRLNCEYIFRPYNDVLYATKLDYWYLILVFIKKKVSDFGVWCFDGLHYEYVFCNRILDIQPRCLANVEYFT